MKTPIELADIRRDDLIRVEQENGTAHEYRALKDAHRAYWGHHYLLDRPTPPVQLPTEPTLGWVNGDWQSGPRLAVWMVDGPKWIKPVDNKTDEHGATYAPSVAAFTPAVAVPKAALDKLRKAENVVRGVNDFLTAVDEANA